MRHCLIVGVLLCTTEHWIGLSTVSDLNIIHHHLLNPILRTIDELAHTCKKAVKNKNLKKSQSFFLFSKNVGFIITKLNFITK